MSTGSSGTLLARVPRGNSEMVAPAIRTIFAQPDAEHVHSQLDAIAGMLRRQFPAVEALLREAEGDLLAYAGFPVAHWKKLLQRRIGPEREIEAAGQWLVQEVEVIDAREALKVLVRP
ncbi:MAG: transposase mutator type [Blastococcus sp.]|nr:transposase mutator type [Blastococcus sp.]